LESLKKIRVVVSILFFLLLTFLFLDIGAFVPALVSNILVSVQIVPSLTRAFKLLTLTSLGLLVVFLLTLGFGRVYCSSLCPLGTLQDVVIRIARRNRKRRWFRYKKAPFLLHYSLLAVSAVAFVGGSVLLLNLLEPFSNFGRVLSTLAHPVIVLANNAVAFVFEGFGHYSVPTLSVRFVNAGAFLFPVVFLVVVVYLSYNYGRLFCNSLCPAGALLGLLSRVSLFRIVIDEETCTECNLCEKVCKARCIEADTKRLDFSACVGCFNCIDVCPSVGLKYEAWWKKKAALAVGVDQGRRTFMNAALASAVAAALPRTVADDTLAARTPTFDESRRNPVVPPGALGVEHFSSYCTACHLCISICPAQVLYPSFLEYGVAGVFQPKMDYNVSYCTYECNLCTQICPSGAILPVDVPAKKLIQIGKASFVKEDCIVITKKKDCGACAEHCPTKAVKMVPYENKLMLPELNNDICVGCGACEHSCPTTPRKAIYVVANRVHLEAKKPPVQKLEEAVEKSKEFPF
jgi:polyferredoxin